LAGGKTIYLQLKAPNYNIDWDEVERGLLSDMFESR